MMRAGGVFSDSWIAEVFGKAWNEGIVTLSEKESLIDALARKSTLNREEKDAIERLLHAIRRGWIQAIE
jgi:hypothetical protein